MGEREASQTPTAAAPGSVFTLSSPFHTMYIVSNLYGVLLLVVFFFVLNVYIFVCLLYFHSIGNVFETCR